MTKITSVFILLFIALVNMPLIAAEVLTVDRAINKNIELSFSNDKHRQAKKSDFNLVNYVLMSSETGQRWAVVTLTNSSSGNRIFESEHLLALFADGSRITPQAHKVNFAGHETQSITLSFGEHKFPILTIYGNNPQQE